VPEEYSGARRKGKTVLTIDSSAALLSSAAPIRNEPVQARSTARLATLLDSAAAVIDEIGYERLTTAMVAERAGASIGTVYRYFPDRIAVLQSLAARNVERLMARTADELAAGRHASALDAVLAMHAVTVDLFRTEPGYRSLRAGDVIDLRPPVTESTANSMLAAAVADALVAHYSVTDSAAMRHSVGTAIELIDALTARAFARNARGDAELLGEAERALRAVLAGRL
jgi:AcrR family transcriptional regulator